MNIKPPMLCKQLEPSDEDIARLIEIHGPVVATPKFDGIRALTYPNEPALSRRLKPIRNHYIQKCIGAYPCPCDGELVTFSDGKIDSFEVVQSKLTTFVGEPDFRYYIFDVPHVADDYQGRLGYMHRHKVHQYNECCELAPCIWCFTLDDVKRAYTSHLELGWEGTIIRPLNSKYQHGKRSPVTYKLKPFADAEGVIIGWEPLYTNTNEPTRNKLGLQERSARIAGLVAVDMLGAFTVMTKEWGEISVGGGYTDLQRCKFWQDREQMMGDTMVFRFQTNHLSFKPHAAQFKAILKNT